MGDLCEGLVSRTVGTWAGAQSPELQQGVCRGPSGAVGLGCAVRSSIFMVCVWVWVWTGDGGDRNLSSRQGSERGQETANLKVNQP